MATASIIEALCVQIFRGAVLQGVGFEGKSYTAGLYQRANGTKSCVLLEWPHGVELVNGDAFDVVIAFVDSLPFGTAERVLERLVAEPGAVAA